MSFSAIIASSRSRGIPVFVGAIADLNVTAFDDTTITLDWTTPTADNPLDYFEVYLDGVFYENTTDATEGWVITGLTASTSYDITLKTVDTLGNKSGFSNEVTQATSGAGLLLDEVAGFIHAYSHRKLRNAYVGSAIRVRRSSDSTTSDIGFISNELDESALTTFTGANDGFKDRFYDQVGSRDLQQTTAENQPKIVDAGTVVKVSGKPYSKYDGTNDSLITAAKATAITDKNCTLFIVIESQSTESYNKIFEEYTGTNIDRTDIISDTRASIFRYIFYAPDSAPPAAIDNSSIQPKTTKRIFCFTKNGSNISAYDENNTLIGTVTDARTFALTTFLLLGGDVFASFFFSGKVAEFLINNTALSSGDRTTVINNIKTHYSIP